MNFPMRIQNTNRLIILAFSKGVAGCLNILVVIKSDFEIIDSHCQMCLNLKEKALMDQKILNTLRGLSTLTRCSLYREYSKEYFNVNKIFFFIEKITHVLSLQTK